MYNLGEGLKNFVVWLIVNLPYLIIWAIIIIVGVQIVRSYYKKSKLKSSLPPQGKISSQKNDEEKDYEKKE
jgi:hypothetical protein